MQIGSYIRHFVYRNKGERIYRYGIIIEIIEYPPPILVDVLWHAAKNYQNPYYEKIKINLLELVSKPR
jgi:hypothetical protein